MGYVSVSNSIISLVDNDLKSWLLGATSSIHQQSELTKMAPTVTKLRWLKVVGNLIRFSNIATLCNIFASNSQPALRDETAVQCFRGSQHRIRDRPCLVNHEKSVQHEFGTKGCSQNPLELAGNIDYESQNAGLSVKAG